jgi:hypothetical protein
LRLVVGLEPLFFLTAFLVALVFLDFLVVVFALTFFLTTRLLVRLAIRLLLDVYSGGNQRITGIPPSNC